MFNECDVNFNVVHRTSENESKANNNNKYRIIRQCSIIR